MKYKILGELAQVVQISLAAGDMCWASRGSLMTYTPEVNWSLKVPGGISGALNRSFSGESVSLVHVETAVDNQMVTLSANQPGKIMAWDLTTPVLTTRGAFVAAFGPEVDISVRITRKMGAAFFGGAGLFLQRISGEGIALVHGSGDFVQHDLEDGQTILVSTGNLAAFSEEVDYDIQGIGGCRRMLFGGEGFFMTKLTGPGRVLLQSLKRTETTKSS